MARLIAQRKAPRAVAEIRELARGFSPDPFPHRGYGEPRDVPWLYAEGDFERQLLHRLVIEGFEANRNVHFAENYARPAQAARFRHLASGTRHDTVPGEATALRVEAGSGWEADAGAGWSSAQVRMGTALPPHLLDEPSVTFEPRKIAPGLFDVGATVLGYVHCRADRQPVLRTGESRDEVLSDELPESRHDMVACDGGWRSAHRLGFRYVRLEAAEEVRVEATVRPVAAPGAFVCSDDALSAIWGTAAYTTRLCQQGLTLDGVKRDRMPWAGDQALGLLTNAFTLADAGSAADTLTALGSPVEGYVNGLADYSMWWVIAQQEMRRFFGDHGGARSPDTSSSAAGSSNLVRRAVAVDEFLDRLSSDVGEDAVLRPRDLGSFAGGGPVLIDWGVDASADEELTALQVLFVWALSSATSLLADASHPGMTRWAELHDRACAALWRRGWHQGIGAWRTHLDGADTDSPYPQLLAVLAGLHSESIPTAVSDRIDLSRVRTPFMTGFALRALHRAGRGTDALGRLRSLWTPMIESGATTFWEEFPHDGESPYEMYGRPFGKSLCHGWGAAPAALLPEIVLGLRPLDVGWSTVEVHPQLGDLEWAAAVVPTPHGDLVIIADGSEIHVEAPAGIRAVVLHEAAAVG
jgi:alpha-L-rhamnosidase